MGSTRRYARRWLIVHRIARFPRYRVRNFHDRGVWIRLEYELLATHGTISHFSLRGANLLPRCPFRHMEENRGERRAEPTSGCPDTTTKPSSMIRIEYVDFAIRRIDER
jgi:hypothetical protein